MHSVGSVFNAVINGESHMENQQSAEAGTVIERGPGERRAVGVVLEDSAKTWDGAFVIPLTETILVSVVIPALNEREGIVRTIRSIPYYELEKYGYEVQLVVVDNGSDDETGCLAGQHGAEVIFEPRRGYGRALRAGFSHARGDIIVTADADGTYPLEDIPRLLNVLCAENLEFLTTNRLAHIEAGAMSPLHRLGNGVLNWASRLLFRTYLRDSQSGMWVFRREVLEDASLRSTSMSLSEELKIEAIYYQKRRWREVPIRYGSRLGDAKIASWKHGCENLFFLLKKRFVR